VIAAAEAAMKASSSAAARSWVDMWIAVLMGTGVCLWIGTMWGAAAAQELRGALHHGGL
jgi:hypothetical protein